MAEQLSIMSVLQVAGLGGAVAAFVNQGLKWGIEAYTERRKQDVEAAYLAMRAVVILERFVSECDAHLRERELAHDMGQMIGAGKLPSLGDFPPDINWRHFDRPLAFAALGLPARIEAAQSACVRADWESDDYWMSQIEAVRLGLDAWSTAQAIRQRYRLGANEHLHALVENMKFEKVRHEKASAGLKAQYKATMREGAAIRAP